MTIVSIPSIRDLGTVPNNNMEESVYNTTAEYFTGQMPGWGGDVKAVAEAARTNAQHSESAANAASGSAGAASASAGSASSSAGAASTSAGNAAASATSANTANTTLQRYYLGAKTSHPTTDNQGAALQQGAWYTNTTNGFWYWWTGSVWKVGVGDMSTVDWTTQVTGKPSLVNSVNGRSGAVTGLVELTIALPDNIDLNTVLTSGFYRLNAAHANATGFDYSYSQMIVSRGGDTVAQEITSSNGLNRAWRTAYNLGGVAVWTPWQRALGDRSLIERSKHVLAPGSAYTADPQEGTLHQLEISQPLTINVATARQAGDQLTIILSFSSASAFAFSSNVKSPVGGIRSAVAGHMLTVPLVARVDLKWQAYDGGLHPW